MDMHVDMRVDMHGDMRGDMRVDMRVDMCVDMCVDECVREQVVTLATIRSAPGGVCLDMRIEMAINMRIGMSAGVRVEMRAQGGRCSAWICGAVPCDVCVSVRTCNMCACPSTKTTMMFKMHTRTHTHARTHAPMTQAIDAETRSTDLA